jgi:hypothetical protein
MLRKTAVCGGMVVLALALLVWLVVLAPPAEPPLRVGMTRNEVIAVMGRPTATIGTGAHEYAWFDRGPDWLGRWDTVYVNINEGKVERWEVGPRSRARLG